MMELDKAHQLVEIALPLRWAGHTLAQLNVRRQYGISVLAIHREGKFIVSPGADIPLLSGDSLLVLGRQEQISFIDS